MEEIYKEFISKTVKALVKLQREQAKTLSQEEQVIVNKFLDKTEMFSDKAFLDWAAKYQHELK